MFGQALRAAWESFRSDRTRFYLALLGVLIGCASLVLLSGLLEGGKEALLLAAQQAAEDDLIEIQTARPPLEQRRRTTRPLQQADVSALRRSPLLEGAARVISMRAAMQPLWWGKKSRRTLVVGASPEAFSLFRLELARGRFLSSQDLHERRKVAVVGHTLWRDLFGQPAQLDGLEIKTATDRFAVVGVLAHHASMKDSSPNLWDERVILPESTFDLLIPPPEGQGRRDTERVFVRLAQNQALASHLDQVRAILKATLLRRHYGVENFHILGEEDDEARRQLIVGIISLLIVGTALVSLVVSGINVMNIMLVSVTERTREIGIRRALGASRGNLMAQFLAEAMAITGLGGLLGILGGIALTGLATAVLDRVLFEWRFYITPWAPPLGFASSLLVGVVFGWLPARRASRLDPVEALRSE